MKFSLCVFLSVCAFNNTFGLSTFSYASANACVVPIGLFPPSEPCALYASDYYLLQFSTNKASYIPGEIGIFTMSISPSNQNFFVRTSLGTWETNSSEIFQAPVPYDYGLQNQTPIQYFNVTVFGKSLQPDNLPYWYFGPGGANVEIAVVGTPNQPCSNEVNDDSDGLVDTFDPQCHTDCNPNNPGSYAPNHNSETTPPNGTCPTPPTLELNARAAFFQVVKNFIAFITTKAFAGE